MFVPKESEWSTIAKNLKRFKNRCLAAHVRIIGVLFVILLFTPACSSSVSPLPPNISGVSNGEVYGTAVLIDIRNPEDGVTYRATIDGQAFELGSVFGEDGIHILTVTASKGNGTLTSQQTLEFEIDKMPPAVPEITGVEAGKTYNSPICVYVYEQDGISYNASIDGKDYIFGSYYGEEGIHELKVHAIKERNGLTSAATIPFSIDLDSYTSDEISYFKEIAFGSEFGGKTDKIRKWQDDINVKVKGQPTEEDMECLSQVVSELNDLIDSLEIGIIEEETELLLPNMEVYFIPHREFLNHASQRIAEENWGLFFYYEDSQGVITRAKVLIASDKANEKERAHLIREEFTQALGLAQDSEKYRDSIFYQGWTTIQQYSELDKKIIKMLYNEEIYPNMNEDKVIEHFEKNRADRNDRYQVFPANQSGSNPSFMQFANELSNSIMHRDLDYILQHVDKDFTVKPLEGRGLEPFKKYFFLETNPEQSILWRVLSDALELGGVFVDPGLSIYEAPYTKSRFPEELESDSCMVALFPDVEVHQYPDDSSSVVDVLRFDVVKVLQPLPLSELPNDIEIEDVFKWERIGTFNGKTGYVPEEQIRRPYSNIVTFKRKNNRWVISEVSNR
jgi:hypothetical protein